MCCQIVSNLYNKLLKISIRKFQDLLTLKFVNKTQILLKFNELYELPHDDSHFICIIPQLLKCEPSCSNSYNTYQHLKINVTVHINHYLPPS
jgi:hypothetical protein